MPQKSLTADRSSLLAQTNTGANLGGGLDAHLPISKTSGGYQLRGLIGFTFPAGFWDDVRKLLSAELLLTNTAGAGTHVGKGASAFVYIYRNTTAWTPNSAGESWTTSPVVYPGPAATGTGGVSGPLDQGAGNQKAFDITAIVLAWAPASVVGPGGALGQGASAHGVGLWESGGPAQAAEVYSAHAGVAAQRPILRLTYESNQPPDAPTIVRPIGPEQVATDFEAVSRDNENDPLTAYDLQVSTDPTFSAVTHWNIVAGSTGISGYTISRNYGGTAMTVGERYYWRIRARDAGGYGAWSSTATFVKKAAGGPAQDAYDYWIDAILENMAPGRTAIELGTIRPLGGQVAELVTADFGELYRVVMDEALLPIDHLVYMLGQRVTLTPDGWTVDAIVELTEPIEPATPEI